MDALKEFFNFFADPRAFFLLTVVALFVIVWKREAFSKDSVGYGILGFLAIFFAFGLTDENFRLIVAKPDNVPIVFLIFLVVYSGLEIYQAPPHAADLEISTFYICVEKSNFKVGFRPRE